MAPWAKPNGKFPLLTLSDLPADLATGLVLGLLSPVLFNLHLLWEASSFSYVVLVLLGGNSALRLFSCLTGCLPLGGHAFLWL